jgi:hypothetical protein
MTIEATVTMRGRRTVIRWIDGRLEGDAATLRRLRRSALHDPDDEVSFLHAVRDVWGDDASTHVTGAA